MRNRNQGIEWEMNCEDGEEWIRATHLLLGLGR
jgi:hypothetical protein